MDSQTRDYTTHTHVTFTHNAYATHSTLHTKVDTTSPAKPEIDPSSPTSPRKHTPPASPSAKTYNHHIQDNALSHPNQPTTTTIPCASDFPSPVSPPSPPIHPGSPPPSPETRLTYPPRSLPRPPPRRGLPRPLLPPDCATHQRQSPPRSNLLPPHPLLLLDPRHLAPPDPKPHSLHLHRLPRDRE